MASFEVHYLHDEQIGVSGQFGYGLRWCCVIAEGEDVLFSFEVKAKAFDQRLNVFDWSGIVRPRVVFGYLASGELGDFHERSSPISIHALLMADMIPCPVASVGSNSWWMQLHWLRRSSPHP